MRKKRSTSEILVFDTNERLDDERERKRRELLDKQLRARQETLKEVVDNLEKINSMIDDGITIPISDEITEVGDIIRLGSPKRLALPHHPTC